MNRLEKILTGILAILLVVVAGLMVSLWSRPAGSSDAVSQTYEPQEHTAKSAYTMAEPVALAWAGDARLLRARATWPNSDSFRPTGANWGFTFYSPGRGATALISIVGNNATLINTRETDRPLAPSDVTHWQVDSPAVLETILSHGGQTFIDNHNSASLVLTLDAEDEITWKGTLVAKEARQTFRLQLDPQSGDPITTTASSAQ